MPAPPPTTSYERRFAARRAARPQPMGASSEIPTIGNPDTSPDVIQLAAPEELIVDHPTAETPSLRQAGTLGESTHAVDLVRATAEASLYYFNLVFMGGHTLMQPRPHQWYCDFLQSHFPEKPRKLLLAPRGTLKTTITEGLLLHLFVQPSGSNIYFPHGKIGYLSHDEGRSTRVLLGSKGSDLSEEKLIHVRTIIENNAMMRAFWPHCFWHDPERQATAWNNQRLFLPRNETFKEGSIETTGVGATVTGEHFNFGLYDDLVDEKDRFSPGNMDRCYNWIHAAHFLLDDAEHAPQVFLGTHWTNNDVYVRMKREDAGLEHRTFSAILEDGSPLWPEVFPVSALQLIEAKLLTSGKGDLYALNYLNDPRHSSIVSFDAGMIRYWRIEGDRYIIDDDPRDLALTQDFTRERAAAQYPSGTRLTPAFYHAHRDELRDGLKGMWLQHKEWDDA